MSHFWSNMQVIIVMMIPMRYGTKRGVHHKNNFLSCFRLQITRSFHVISRFYSEIRLYCYFVAWKHIKRLCKIRFYMISNKKILSHMDIDRPNRLWSTGITAKILKISSNPYFFHINDWRTATSYFSDDS